MMEHLTQQDMIRYVDIASITPENLALIGQIHTHVYQCESCQIKLEEFCLQAQQSEVSSDRGR